MRPYRLGLYEKAMPDALPLGQKLEAAAAAGFDYMELSIDESDQKLSRLNWRNNEIRELAAAMADTGVPIGSICLSGHRRFPMGSGFRDIRARSMEIMEQAIALAARLGVRIIQLAGYDVYYEESTEQTVRHFGENLARAAAMAAREGVLLGFETMETSFMNTVEKAMEWVDAIGSPYLQVYPDIGNLTNAAMQRGGHVADDLRKGAGHIAAVHLKETVPGVFREVPYGAGHVDFASLAPLALEMGVGMFVGEFWHKGEENWPDLLAQNNAFLRRTLDGPAHP